MPGGPGLRIAHQPIHTDNLITRRTAMIQQHQMIEIRIEPVLLQPRLMIDKRAIAAQFAHKHLVSQALRGPKILRIGRQTHLEMTVIDLHMRPQPSSRAGLPKPPANASMRPVGTLPSTPDMLGFG